MLEASSLFDENSYLTANPDVAAAKNQGLLNSGYDHFMQFGKFEGRSPSFSFDHSLYLSKNPDLAQALSAGVINSAFDHLVQYGQKENRADSLVFDNRYYLAQNPDVAGAVNRDELTGIEHFAKFGVDEGRASSEAFDVRYYLNRYPDLQAAGLNNRQALQHFVTYGLAEGRASSEKFDVSYYLNRYPDLQAAGLNNEQALEHFLVHGIGEGRVGSMANQPLIGLIDTGFSENNPDINYSRIALGKDRVDGDDNPLLSADEGNEHGTHILGIIGATKNNNVGIDGINDDAPLWVGRAVGSGQWAESLMEFVDAAKQSQQPNAIANLSLDLTQIDLDGNLTTRYELTPREREALEYARQNGVLVVVPAGNDGDVMSALGQASQEFDNIITVGATDNQNRTDYSSYGDGLDIVTEGGTILDPVQSLVGDDVGTMAGTSVAAAKVTGAASLVWKANPQLNYQQVIEILKSTATDINNPGWDEQTGNGLLNQAKAVETAKITTPVDYTPEPIPLIDTWDGEGQFIPQERPAADKFKDKYYEWVSYTVKPGDTLSEIAIRTMGEGTEAYYEFIAEHNNIANPDLIKVGQKIEIPKQVSAPSSKPDTGDTSEEQVSPPPSKPDTGNTSEEQVSPPSSKPDTGNTSENKNKNYEWETYIIREGDTLSELAQKRTGNASDYKLIADKNNIANSSLIYPGDEILVPKAVSDSKPENDKPQQPSQSTNINGHTIGGNFYSVYQNNQNNLGKPTSNAIKTSDDVSYQLFEKGSIVSSENGTFPLYGAIRQKYLNSSGLDGWLGAPTGGEKELANGNIKQTFENGYIVWNGKNAISYKTGSGKPSNSVSPPTGDIEFGSYKPTSKYVTPAFLDKVEDIGRRLDVAPEYLMAVMGFETGGSYSPKIKNAAGSGATGLIQFMPRTAKNLGTSTAALGNMSAVQQLDYVEKYLSPYKGRLDTLEDTYMAVLWPKAVGKNPNYHLFSKGGDTYQLNKGLDTNDDGVVTVKEAASKVRKYLPGSDLFDRQDEPDSNKPGVESPDSGKGNKPGVESPDSGKGNKPDNDNQPIPTKTISKNLEFALTDQSLWGGGKVTNPSLNVTGGPKFEKEISLGVLGTATAKGGLDYKFEAFLSPGTFDVDFPALFDISYAGAAKAGGSVAVNFKSKLGSKASLKTELGASFIGDVKLLLEAGIKDIPFVGSRSHKFEIGGKFDLNEFLFKELKSPIVLDLGLGASTDEIKDNKLKAEDNAFQYADVVNILQLIPHTKAVGLAMEELGAEVKAGGNIKQESVFDIKGFEIDFDGKSNGNELKLAPNGSGVLKIDIPKSYSFGEVYKFTPTVKPIVDFSTGFSLAGKVEAALDLNKVLLNKVGDKLPTKVKDFLTDNKFISAPLGGSYETPYTPAFHPAGTFNPFTVAKFAAKLPELSVKVA